MKSNTLTLIVITLLLAAGAYWYFSTNSGNQQPLVALSPSASQQNSTQIRFQTLVNELQKISFDTSIFSDPRFLSLVSLATPVAPESLGRLDPFAPIFSGMAVPTLLGAGVTGP